MSRVFEPLIADWQLECLAAAGWQQWLCRVRGIASFIRTFVIVLVRELPRPVPEIRRLVLRYATFVIVSSVVLLLPFTEWLTTSNASLLLPSTLALGLPLGLVPAAIWLAARDYQTHDARRALVRLAACAALAQVLLVGWITPAANQMWREDVFARLQKQGLRGGSPARGERELTLPELWFDGGSDAIASPRARAREKHARVIVSLSPIFMSVVGLLLAQQGRGPRRRIATGWLGVPVTWFAVSSVAEASVRTGAPPGVLWATPITLVAIAYACRDGARDGSPTLAHPRS